jgi:hypothetical protein
VRKLRLPSPATVLATIALFVALGGTAVAAGIVPKAKFALNSGKLQGKTAAQVAAVPGPATAAAGLVTPRTSSFSVPPSDGRLVITTCQAGEKAISGGFTTNGALLPGPTAPSSDGASWQLVVVNIGDSTAAGTAYALCLK